MAIKNHEYRLMEAISEDSGTTQATLAAKLGIAVGSVNWYIKRLIGRGYLKVTRMDRTRLRYNLTSKGMTEFTRNATQYARDSLKIYKNYREEAKKMVELMNQNGVSSVFPLGNDETTDIMRLTCLEAGIRIDSLPVTWVIKHNDGRYELSEKSSGVSG